MRLPKNILYIMLITLVCGCSAARQFVPVANGMVPPQKARIYVLRPSEFGGEVKLLVWDGERIVGETRKGSYLCWDREPGDVTICSESETSSKVTLHARARQTYYLIQRIYPGLWEKKAVLKPLPADEAAQALKTCRPASYP